MEGEGKGINRVGGCAEAAGQAWSRRLSKEGVVWEEERRKWAGTSLRKQAQWQEKNIC